MLRSVVLVVATASFAVVYAVGCVRDPELNPLSDGGESVATDGTGIDPAPDGAPPAIDAAAIGDGAPLDDAAAAACAAVCGAAGGTCVGATCVIACPGAPSCLTGVTCAPGVPCQIKCVGKTVCGQVSCGTAPSCSIECTGEQACLRVSSSSAQTVLVCTGKDACKTSICSGDTCSIQCWNEGCRIEDLDCCAKQCTVNGAPGRCN
jgi:hypothetical protein